ncbi:MAG TPA: hypothetical protein PLJ34_05765 [Hyphomicrobiales bacterium]|nr:hypothetical protein [Kaistiaceae bacterium]HQF30935.1 hypothetical protein [Hyphomicrobiales bacterium]
MKFIEKFLGVFSIVPILFILALLFAQIVAATQGLDSWLGISDYFIILLIAILFFAPPIGGIAIAIIGYFGATKGWHWEWWQASLLCFPTAILGILVMFGAASFSALDRLKDVFRSRPSDR